MTKSHLVLFFSSLALAIAALGLAPAGVARAQATPAAEAADREARARFESGRLALEAGRYEEALADFRRSYELSHRGPILFNIGIVQDRLRRDREALEAFERYLVEVPDAENRAEVEARIAVLRTAIASIEREPPMDHHEEMPIEPPPPPPAHQLHYEIGGWVASGLTVASVAAAIGLWVAANDRYSELDQRCGDAGCARGDIDASGAPDLVVGTNVMVVSSIVSALCAGLAWTLWAVDVPSAPGVSATSLRIGPTSLQLTF